MAERLFRTFLYIFLFLTLTPTIYTKNSTFDFLSDDLVINENIITKEFSILEPIEKVFSTELGKYFLKFASFGYCTIKEMEEGNCCQELLEREGWDVIVKETINLDNYNFAILKNDIYKKIIITFPGTRGKYQLVEEIYYSNGVPLEGEKSEKIMNYFKQVWVLIKSVIGEKLNDLYEIYPDYQYIFTGHSLGAAIASIAALDSVKYGNLIITDISPVLITFGQPRTGNDIFANEVMNYIPIIYRVVRQGDMVASLPMCIYGKFLQTCMNNLPDSKFVEDLWLSPQQIKAEEDHFYSWHLGNLMLYTEDMTDFVDCKRDYGDNHPDPKCKLSLSVNINNHVIYFNQYISKLCRQK
jgi:hypothetical protein